jgi:LysM repeat protein
VGLIPLVAAVLASEWPFGSGAQRAAAPPAATSIVSGVTATAPPALTLQTIPAPPQATSAATAAAAAPAPTRSAAAAAPAPAAPSVAAEPTRSGPATGPFVAYRVQPGDTVKSVAGVFGVSPASVSSASGLQNPDRLTVGQILTIPNQPGYLYRVQPGETLDQIAARVGIASDTIASASKVTPAAIRPGDVLLIPDLTAAGK